MADVCLLADFTKIDKKLHIVEGWSTTSSVDRDGQIIDENFLRNNYKQWAEEFGNIRYMHQVRVVGHVLTCSDWDEEMRGFYITAKISAPDVWTQIEDHEINAFSVGIKGPTIVSDPIAKNGRLIDGEIIETSVVDIGSNKDSTFTVVKTPVVSSFDTDSNSWEVNKTIDTNNPSAENMFDWMNGMMDGFADNNPNEADVAKRYYSDKERKDMPESDFAGPHKSFPIKDQSDVENAAHLIGHAKDPEAVRRKIIEIAHRKGLKIPEAWQKDESHKTLDTSSGLQPYNLEGDNSNKEEKTTVADENENVTEKSTTVEADTTKAAVSELHQAIQSMNDMMTTFGDALGKIQAMAAPQDPDHDGDVDNTNRPEEEAGEDNKGGENTHAATTNAPNAVEEMENNALGLKTTEIMEQLMPEIQKLVDAKFDEKADVITKSVSVDTDGINGMVAGLQKSVEAFSESLPKLVERLEVVEQSAAPSKGVSNATTVEKFATADDKGEQQPENLYSKAVSIVNEKYHNISPTLKNHYVELELAKLKGGNN